MAKSSLLQCFFVMYLPHRFTLFFEPDEHNLCILHCILNTCIVIHVHVHETFFGGPLYKNNSNISYFTNISISGQVLVTLKFYVKYKLLSG